MKLLLKNFFLTFQADWLVVTSTSQLVGTCQYSIKYLQIVLITYNEFQVLATRTY